MAKVIIACERLGAPSETWLYRQVTCMRQHEVHVVCHEHLNPTETPYDRVTVVPKARVTRFQLRSWPGRLRNKLSGNTFGAFGETGAAYKAAIQKVKPDVILCQFSRTALYWAPAAQQSSIPIVVHFHGIDASAWLQAGKYLNPVKAVLPNIERAVIVATYMRNNLVRLGYPDDRIHLIPCGTPIPPPPAPKSRDPKSPVTILAVGRLVLKKDPLSLVRAFKRATELGVNAKLRIIGTGPLEPALRATIEAGRLSDRVTLLGAQPFDTVRHELSLADIFAQHSVTGPDGDMEGWPVAVAEAMAAGLPVVSTRHAGIVDQVVEGQTGYLVPEHDWKQMGERIADLCNDEQRRVEMGRAGRLRAENHFDVGQRVVELEEVLKLASQSKGRTS